MKTIVYSPEAIEKIRQIGSYIEKDFGKDKAKAAKKRITSGIRMLEKSEEAGIPVGTLYGLKTEYRRLYISPNYIFYRIDGNTIRIIDVLHEKEDFMYRLFGVRTQDSEAEAYWDDVEWKNKKQK